MKRILCFALILTMIFTPMCVYTATADAGTVYYIDAENGDDLNSGLSEDEPLRTLTAASSIALVPGDKLLLKAGSIFNECFTAGCSGTAEEPIVLGAYGDTEALGKPIMRSDEEDAVLLMLHNVAGWTVENIEFTAPNGNGIYIRSSSDGITSDITVRDCVFHDIWNKQCSDHNGNHSPIYIRSSGEHARIYGVHIADCEIYDCAFGIKTGGLNREHNPDRFVSTEESYNAHFLFEGIRLYNINYDAIMLCAVNGMVIRNCSLINTALRDDYYSAPLWSHHVCNYLVENCEIAGSTNEKDGMAVDFDGWTTDATYQYIYSHDNVRFINSCCCDNYTKNANCTVRYCLSVNDNKQPNRMGNLLYVAAVDYAPDELPRSMDNFKFYNNTLVNCSEINCGTLTNSLIANNIFVGMDTPVSVLDIRRNKYADENFVTKFNGEFRNNCFWNMGVPDSAKNNYICDPKFAGTDETDKNSYMLTEKSGLLGKGIQAEANMGDHDFYGNALTDKHNIGCYEGSGEKVQETAKSCIILETHKTNVVKASTLFATVLGRTNSFFNAIWIF